MGKKKRYIDKNKSVSFHLVDRPHDDPTGFDSNNVRVWHQAGPGSQRPVFDQASQRRREEQKACGIYFDDDYDYMKHLRDRFGVETETDLTDVPLWENIEAGQFDDVVSVKSGKSRGGRSKKSDLFCEADFPSLIGDGDGFETSFAVAVENQSDYNVMAAVSQEKPGPHWDKDIAATMDDEFKDFCDDLEDDFVALAGGICDDDYDEDFPELGAAGDYDADDDDEQNYDDADDDKSLTREGGRENDWRDVLAETEDQHTDLPLLEERERFLNAERPNYLESKSQKSRFTEYSLTSSAIPRSECQTDLDDHFETMYGEYDDLEVGGLDHEGVQGHITIDHPSILRVLGLDEENSTANDKSQGMDDPEMRITIEDMTLRDQESASDVDSDDLFPEPPPKPEFDCESILSTYSNIYNRPKVITAEKKVQLDQSGVPKLDKEYPPPKLPNPEDDEMDRLKWIPPNVRRRDETKEETRARQRIQKEEQRLRRIEKKNNKLAFKMEEIRQQRADINKQRSSGFKY